MPVFRHGDALSYFAHIPKCAGTSVERYLISRFGEIGFYDKTASMRGAAAWSRTSPQHIDWASLQTILPASFLTAVFAVVRHPVARAVSAYQFQVEVERKITPETPFSDWLRNQASAFAENPFIMDNHFRPQSDFVPEVCEIFHLEHGLEAIIPYLDNLAGDEKGPRSIERANSRAHDKRRVKAAPVTPTSQDLALLQKLYAADFARFGYVVDAPAPTATQPKLAPELSATPRPLDKLTNRIRRGLGY